LIFYDLLYFFVETIFYIFRHTVKNCQGDTTVLIS